MQSPYRNIYCIEVNTAPALSAVVDGLVEFDGREMAEHITAPALLLSGKDDIFTGTALAGEVQPCDQEFKDDGYGWRGA
jgi:hypothetical protein